MQEMFAPLREPMRRADRVAWLEVLVLGGLPDEDENTRVTHDAIEEIGARSRQREGGAESELGVVLLTREESRCQDELDRIVIEALEGSSLEIEDLVCAPEWEPVRAAARRLISRLIDPTTLEWIDLPEWREERLRVEARLANLPGLDS